MPKGSLSRTIYLLLVVLAAFLSVHRAEAGVAGASVHSDQVVATRTDDGFTVDVDIVIAVPVSVAWAVITDFQHMAEFVPNLTESQVLERNPTGLRVRQRGYKRIGPFSFDFEYLREIRMTPESELRAQGIGGSFKRIETITRLKSVAQGTRLEYHVEAQPNFWVPPWIGPLILRDQTAEQFSALVAEMLKRR